MRLEHQRFADAAFLGKGPSGPVHIGIELKNTMDLIDSMRGRLAGHQIPGLLETYDYVWLIVEGTFPASADGRIRLRGPRRALYVSDVLGYLTSLEIQAGVKVKRTVDTAGTAAEIARLYRWWQKPWDHHTSLKVVHRPAETLDLRRDSEQVKRKRRVAMALSTGIGWARSAAVAKRFDSVLDMIVSSPTEWTEIDGIGKGLAQSINAGIHEGSHE